MNHMNHSVPICLLEHDGPIGFVLLQFATIGTYHKYIVTPAHGSVVHMFHECKDVKIILIANGWPENGIEITHYSSTQREDENRKLLPNFDREWPQK